MDVRAKVENLFCRVDLLNFAKVCVVITELYGNSSCNTTTNY